MPKVQIVLAVHCNVPDIIEGSVFPNCVGEYVIQKEMKMASKPRKGEKIILPLKDECGGKIMAEVVSVYNRPSVPTIICIYEALVERRRPLKYCNGEVRMTARMFVASLKRASGWMRFNGNREILPICPL